MAVREVHMHCICGDSGRQREVDRIVIVSSVSLLHACESKIAREMLCFKIETAPVGGKGRYC